MDRKFHPAMAAISDGDLEKFKALIAEDPSLAAASTTLAPDSTTRH